MDEVVISYETLYELLRIEKNREAIQELPDGFMNNLNNYTKSLKKNLNGKKREITSFDGGVIQKHEKHLDSLIKVIQDLYSRREKKILTMALIKSRTRAQLVDVANMTDEEKVLFESLVRTMDVNRALILDRMLGHGTKPVVADTAEGTVDQTASSPGNAMKDDGTNMPADLSSEVPSDMPFDKPSDVKKTIHSDIPVPTDVSGQTSTNIPSDTLSDAKKDVKPVSLKVTVRITHPVPKFYDRDMNVLGPYEEDEIANLPSDIAGILVKKGRAEKINT